MTVPTRAVREAARRADGLRPGGRPGRVSGELAARDGGVARTGTPEW
ncbi:hypothetical protein [Streptomyces asiaticus]